MAASKPHERPLPHPKLVAKDMAPIFKKMRHPSTLKPKEQAWVSIRNMRLWEPRPIDLIHNYHAIHAIHKHCFWKVPPLHWTAAVLMWCSLELPGPLS